MGLIDKIKKALGMDSSHSSKHKKHKHDDDGLGEMVEDAVEEAAEAMEGEEEGEFEEGGEFEEEGFEEEEFGGEEEEF